MSKRKGRSAEFIGSFHDYRLKSADFGETRVDARADPGWAPKALGFLRHAQDEMGALYEEAADEARDLPELLARFESARSKPDCRSATNDLRRKLSLVRRSLGRAARLCAAADRVVTDLRARGHVIPGTLLGDIRKQCARIESLSDQGFALIRRLRLRGF